MVGFKMSLSSNFEEFGHKWVKKRYFLTVNGINLLTQPSSHSKTSPKLQIA